MNRTNKSGILLAMSLFGSAALGQTEPKWELGVGIGSQTLADYRGSKHYEANFLPIPFIVYNGDFLKADDDGIRGLFHKTDRFELNISIAGSLNGNGEDSPLREGMPELHPAAEIGPSANFNLTGQDFNKGWSLRIPVRGVFTFDVSELDVDHIGYLANPQFTYEGLDWKGWDGSLDLGILYGSKEYHEYYYSVTPQFAIAERPAYEADSGYSGSYFNFSMVRREGRLWYGGYLRYDNLNGTAFADSPLVETDHYFTLGLGVSWVLRQSKTMVPVED